LLTTVAEYSPTRAGDAHAAPPLRLVTRTNGAELRFATDILLRYAAAREGMDIAKPRISLISSGDFAWYDHVKVWDATPDPLWTKRKEEVLKLKAKHQ
jgi:hypothetical protein